MYPSVVPFLPPLTDATIKDYWTFYLGAVAAIITFGALLAPALELHLGMGGTIGRLLEQAARWFQGRLGDPTTLLSGVCMAA